MATTTVKGAGRARHEANKRHQQRTPLPPKGKAPLTPAELKTRRDKEATALKEAAGIPRKRSATPQNSRVLAFLVDVEAAAANGWKLERVSIKDGTTVVEATRGEESITCTWVGNTASKPLGHHLADGHSFRVPNTATARRIMATEPGSTKAPVRKAPERRGEHIDVGNTSRRKRIPFDVEAASDAEVLAAVDGRKLAWRNTITGGIEEARVPNIVYTNIVDKDDKPTGEKVRISGKQTKIENGLNGRRILTFCDIDSGFRSVALETLISVR